MTGMPAGLHLRSTTGTPTARHRHTTSQSCSPENRIAAGLRREDHSSQSQPKTLRFKSSFLGPYSFIQTPQLPQGQHHHQHHQQRHHQRHHQHHHSHLIAFAQPRPSSLERPLAPVGRHAPVSLLPRPLTYSTRLADADPHQIAELWKVSLGCDRDPVRIKKALRHSFALVVAIDYASPSVDGGHSKRVVGIGRAVSDGAFVATICDVAVLPEYRKRGIGRRIVRELVKDMRGRGPSGFAAFPPPLTRRFFWHLGFRPDKKYRMMEYNNSHSSEASTDRNMSYSLALGVGLKGLLQRIFNSTVQNSLFRHGEALYNLVEDSSQNNDTGVVPHGEALLEGGGAGVVPPPGTGVVPSQVQEQAQVKDQEGSSSETKQAYQEETKPELTELKPKSELPGTARASLVTAQLPDVPSPEVNRTLGCTA